VNSRLLDHCCAITDGSLTPQALTDLESILRADESARRDYIDFMRLQSLLERERAQGSGFRVQDQTPSPMLRPSHSWRGRSVGVYSAFALAALITLALTAWFLFSPNPQPPTPSPSPTSSSSVALLSDLSPDAAFASPPIPMNPGADLPSGPIRLAAGRAQIMFASTAVADLTGPCEFELTGPNSARLWQGNLRVHVPDRAAGFTLDTAPGVRIVDLGTAFEVTHRPDGRLTVAVTQGRVRLESTRGRFAPLTLNPSPPNPLTPARLESNFLSVSLAPRKISTRRMRATSWSAAIRWRACSLRRSTAFPSTCSRR
jgi:ferric-dicitrate binding protein FerR (iron transport regulator)